MACKELTERKTMVARIKQPLVQHFPFNEDSVLEWICFNIFIRPMSKKRFGHAIKAKWLFRRRKNKMRIWEKLNDLDGLGNKGGVKFSSTVYKLFSTW